MATEQELVVQDLALNIVAKTDNLVTAVMALRDLQEWRSEADIDFTDYESGNDDSNTQLYGENCENTQLQHIDGSMLNKISGKILGAASDETDCIMHHLENTTVTGGPLSGKTYWEVIQMVRRNR